MRGEAVEAGGEAAANASPAKARPRCTKTLSWRETDQVALSALRVQVAATTGRVLSERDLVAAAIKIALRHPESVLELGRPAR